MIANVNKEGKTTVAICDTYFQLQEKKAEQQQKVIPPSESSGEGILHLVFVIKYDAEKN